MNQIESIEPAYKKYLYYCNSNEFDTVFNNKLLEKMMYVKEKNYIMMACLLSGLSLLAIAYLLSEFNKMQDVVTIIYQNTASMRD